MRGRGGSGALASSDHQQPRAPRCPLTGLRASRCRGHPARRPYSGGRAGVAGPTARAGAPDTPAKECAWVLRFALFVFLIGGRGRTSSFWRIVIPSSLVSGCLQRAHLESTAPPNAALPRWVDKWKWQIPCLLPLQPLVWEIMFHAGFPAARSGPPAERRRRETGTPGLGRRERARPGAVPTSSTVSGMQIRYSFSSMVLPAADLRGGKRGTPPQDQQGCRPGAKQGARNPRQSSLRGALSSWLPPVLLRACQGLGPVFVAPPPPSTPRSVLPERGVAKSGGREGYPLETLRSAAWGGRSGRRIRTCPAASEGGEKKRFP